MLHMPSPMMMANARGPVGQVLFQAAVDQGLQGSWLVPAGVFSICVVCIGQGRTATAARSGSAGALAYVNDIPVTPGELLPYELAQGSRLLRADNSVLVGVNAGGTNQGGTVLAGTGFSGGAASTGVSTGEARNGAGAGGYTSAGQNAQDTSINAGFGGGGSSPYGGGAGGSAGAASNNNGVDYGGGGAKFYIDGALYAGRGGAGCVRIIWGAGRAFPFTNTGDM